MTPAPCPAPLPPLGLPRDHTPLGWRRTWLLQQATLGLRDRPGDMERCCYVEAVEEVTDGDLDAADAALREAAAYRRAGL